MSAKLLVLSLILASTVPVIAQDKHASPGKQIAPKSTAGEEMTLWDDRHCAKIVFLFWADGNYTSAGMVVPGCHSFIEVTAESGTYEWDITGFRHGFLELRRSGGITEKYKLTFDTPMKATGFISEEDPRPYKFTFKNPWDEAKQ